MTTKYMPEVGTECEYTHGEWGEWVKIVVKAASGDEFWVKDEYGDAIVSINEHTFRPLKTQDDIEREEEMDNLIDVIKNADYPANIAARVLDAGYHNGPKVGEKVVSMDIYPYSFMGVGRKHAIGLEELLKNFDVFRKVEK